MKASGMTFTALAIATLLVALSFVTWRQARSLDALAELERIEREISLVEAERGELERRIQTLESRGRVVPAARERLGMHTPGASEIILLPGETP